MTVLVESATADDQSVRGEVRDATEPIPELVLARRDSGWFAAIDGWHGIGWLSCGAAGGLAIVHPARSRRDGVQGGLVFGAVVFCALLVVMWQTVNVQRQANQRAAQAGEQLRIALAAAEERSAREMGLTQKLHRAELESQQESHRAAMDARRAQAELERRYLLNQLQKQAVIVYRQTRIAKAGRYQGRP